MQVSRPTTKFGTTSAPYPLNGYQPSFQMGPPSLNGASTINPLPMSVPQMNTFAPAYQSRFPYTLTVRYGDQKENRIENVERNRKMNLLLSHPEIPENAKIEVPAELRAEQKEWNKIKKETEALSQRKFKLEVSVLNEDKGKVEQCAKCRKSNESKTRSFVRVRSSHIYCKNRSISLPVKFGCIPSHQDNRPKELFIEIKLINENPERIEFYALVPLRFRKHKRKRSAKASPMTSPGTTSPVTSPLTSPRGMSLSPWGINQLHPPELQPFTSWPTIEDNKPHVPMGYPPTTNPNVHWALPHDIAPSQFSELHAEVHYREGSYAYHHAKGSQLDHMIESPHQSPPCSPGAPGSPGTFLSGYGSPTYDDFDFSLNKLPHGVEIDQLPAYLQRLRVHELEDKNRRLEDETAACRRMLDECKRVLKTATVEIERLTKENQRLNFTVSHKDQELETERRLREQAQKQLDEAKSTKSGSKFLQSCEKPRASASSGSVSGAGGGSFISSNKNPFTAKEDIDAVRRNLKPVDWVSPAPQQGEGSEFACKARVSTSGTVQTQSQGKAAPPSQFSFGFTNLPLFSEPRS